MLAAAPSWLAGGLAAGLVEAAEAAADLAREIVRPLFRTRLVADAKDDESPVTIADRNAERAIRDEIAARFPGHGIEGEEFGCERPGASLRWVIDPIDGTRAFITGRPVFGTLIALLDEGRPVLGLIDQPVTGERWIGIAGQPTRFTGPFGGVVGARACPALAQAEMSCTAPDMVAGAAEAQWRRLADAARRVSWGGDCYAYGLLALGQIDIIAEASLKVWDWAAVLPVIEGAGGRMTDWSGLPLRADGDGRVLAVGDQRLLRPALERLSS